MLLSPELSRVPCQTNCKLSPDCDSHSLRTVALQGSLSPYATRHTGVGLVARRHDLAGALLVVAGCWLNWDMAVTLAAHPLRLRGWQFCLPYFLACVDSGHWTLIYDIGIGLILVGGYLLRFDGHRPHLHITAQVKSFVAALAIGIGVGASLVMFLLALDPLRLLWG